MNRIFSLLAGILLLVGGVVLWGGPARAAHPAAALFDTSLLSEDFESGTLGRSHFRSLIPTCAPGGCGWAVTTMGPHTGSYAVHAGEVAGAAEQQLLLTEPLALPADATQVTLRFWHHYAFDDAHSCGVLEVSNNAGARWTDLDSHILQGGYTGSGCGGGQNALTARRSWNGTSSPSAYNEVDVDLTQEIGRSILLRFRLGTSSTASQPGAGWSIDDVQVVVNTPATPTRTAAPATATPGTPGAVPTYPPTPLPGSGSHRFPETGKTVSGLFLDYWTGHGGLAQQGYPISEPFGERSDLNGQVYTVQYFERSVFEYHPENTAPFKVLLSQLGTFQYRRKYPQGAPGQHANPAGGNSRLFAETGHTVGGLFWTYWQSHGGLAQQGYPLSEEFTEVNDLDHKPYTVQYFERAVFERHPENAGTPYEVLLSQLGTFQYRQKYGGPAVPTPVPGATATAVPGATPSPAATLPPAPGPTGTPHTYTVRYGQTSKGSTLDPRTLDIAAGDSVSFLNDGTTGIRFITEDGSAASFSLDVNPGDTGSLTLLTRGVYTYDAVDRTVVVARGTITVH